MIEIEPDNEPTRTYTVTAIYPRESCCAEQDGATDADVRVVWSDGETWSGRATLVPEPQNNGQLASWGSVDCWLSESLVERMCGLSNQEHRELCRSIEWAVQAVAK